MIRNLIVLTMVATLCVSATAQTNSAPETITIELSPGNRLDYGDIDDATYVPLVDADGADRYSEAIVDVPTQYSVADTFFICVQPQQDAFQKHGAVANDPQFYDTDGSPFYSASYVDCIVSACTIIDPVRGECVIIDSNNDEDLTNDPVLQYKTDTLKLGQKTYDRVCVDSEVMVDYYDGQQIRTATVPLRFFHTAPGYGREYGYRLNTMQVGELVLDDKTYTVGIPHCHALELYRATENWRLWGGQRVWIDLNRNGRFEWSDFYDDFKQPDTLLNATYQGIEINRFASRLVLEKLDMEKYPVIAVGNPAPVFSAETLDATTFDLAAQRGQYVLMDFWGSWCGPCIGDLPFIKEAHAHFGGKLCIIGIAADDNRDELESCIAEQGLSWPQIQTTTSGMIPTLYQVSGYPSLFLIGPDGTLIAEGADLRGEYLIPALEKHIR